MSSLSLRPHWRPRDHPSQHRIGQDGFGYIGSAAGHLKIPQLGRVIIQDDVEIGACVTIDRGALGDTRSSARAPRSIILSISPTIAASAAMSSSLARSASPAARSLRRFCRAGRPGRRLRSRHDRRRARSRGARRRVRAMSRRAGLWRISRQAAHAVAARSCVGQKTVTKEKVAKGAESPRQRGNMTRSPKRRRRTLAEEARESIDIKRIMELLPHRYPMLMIDRIEDINPGVSATGIKNVTINEPFFQGHLPGHPIMPGVSIVEAMAQTAGALVDSPRAARRATRSSTS